MNPESTTSTRNLLIIYSKPELAEYQKTRGKPGDTTFHAIDDH
jgi:hypothetical protein